MNWNDNLEMKSDNKNCTHLAVFSIRWALHFPAKSYHRPRIESIIWQTWCSTRKSFIKGQNVIFNKKNVLSNLKTCYPVQNRAILLENVLVNAKRVVQSSYICSLFRTFENWKSYIINIHSFGIVNFGPRMWDV